MKLSIIIVNYNTKKLTLDCIASIFKHSPSFPFEIIVVDNGSSDGLVEELKENKKIVFIQNKENLGYSKANNQGIKIARGEFILLLNSDTKVTQNSLDLLVEFAQKTPDCGAVASQLLNPDGSIQPSVFRFPTIIRAIKQYWFGQKGILDKYAPIGQDPRKVEVAVMASFLITPKVLKEVGMLDERYFMFFEDFDYCKRINENCLSVYYLPDSKVYHYHGASGKKIASSENQWRRLIPSSKIYHGVIGHYIYNFILWSNQKMLQLFK